MLKIDKHGVLRKCTKFALNAKRPVKVSELKAYLQNINDDDEVIVEGVGSAWITGFDTLHNKLVLFREV